MRRFFPGGAGTDVADEFTIVVVFDEVNERFVARFVPAVELLEFVVVVVVVVGRLGDGGRIGSSLIGVGVNTVNDGAGDSNANDVRPDEFMLLAELLLLVRNVVDGVVIDDETVLLIIKRDVEFVTMDVVLVGIELLEIEKLD